MTTNDARVTLRFRTLGPGGINPVQSRVIDRLQTLGETESVAELDIDVWGPSMGGWSPADRDPTGTRETVAEFEQWANDHGCTLRPALDRRGAGSGSDDGGTRGGDVVLPLLCLAIYDGETLRAVYPHVDGEEVHTIHDGIEVLESLAARDESDREAVASLS
ncbi:HTH domain-containing protein [Halalkalicoccus sp. NIPERK01]|uniref:HTH domain-containing protein n=1 Tax=Halalkalicoccus sp. NIPERK01 TaxID=3053469 RepID=UPI00256EEF31|nr:HTH domain-containing protein [Halalkalicoccus sp. NIPERK01]MDL5362232.1 hypothetical protein [Halalkalicoccus sp. NIPERK01]